MEYLSKQKAEELSGFKLDGRKKYFLWDNEVCYDEKFLNYCSGCTEHGEYGTLLTGKFDEKRQMTIGIGCSECGYTGVRRDSFPCPVSALFVEV